MRRFQFIKWSRVKYHSPIVFDEAIRIGKNICFEVNRIDLENDDEEEIRIAILSILPTLSRMLTGITSTINTAIKKKEITFAYEGEKKFSSIIRVGLYYVKEELKKIENDILATEGRKSKGELIKAMNFIESIVCLVYDSINESMRLEPKDKYRFYYALWTNMAERLVPFIKPVGGSNGEIKTGSAFIDYNEFLEKTKETEGKKLKELDEIKSADDMLKFISSGGNMGEEQ